MEERASNAFVADSIGVSFAGKQVLKAASVWANPGEITVLLGRNGSGKSTLFRGALGLVSKDFGAVRFRSRVFLRPNLHQLAVRGLFYLPDLGLLSRRRTLAQHLDLLRRRFPGDFRDGFPPDLEVGPLLGKTKWQMSGGEERRAELSLVWARRPVCLLADEPMAGIAPKDQEVVAEVLRGVADGGCAMVLTGHDVGPLMGLADQIVWMVAGTTHGIGTPAEARAHEQFRREYLGPGV